MNLETGIQISVFIGTAVGIYAAVRADLASLKVRMDRAERDIQTIFTGKADKP